MRLLILSTACLLAGCAVTKEPLTTDLPRFEQKEPVNTTEGLTHAYRFPVLSNEQEWLLLSSNLTLRLKLLEQLKGKAFNELLRPSCNPLFY